MTIWEATQHLLPGEGRRRLTDDEQAEIQDVLDAAMEWQAGRLPWQEADRLGSIERDGIPLQSYTRFVALRYTTRDDPRWAALRDLCGFIDAALGGVHTRHGRFTRQEMAEMEHTAW